MGPLERSLSAALLLAALPVSACVIPDEGDAPLRRMVAKVKYLPEIEAWQATLPPGTVAHFEISSDAPLNHSGRCYWPVEARAAGARWNLFYVSADGRHLLVARQAGPPIALGDWRRAAHRQR